MNYCDLVYSPDDEDDCGLGWYVSIWEGNVSSESFATETEARHWASDNGLESEDIIEEVGNDGSGRQGGA